MATCGLALVVMTGCGGGDDEKAVDTTAPPSTAAGTATTVRPVDTSFTGANSAQFCGLARTFNERFSKVTTNPTPAELRTVSREGQAAINQALNAAPAEIKKDVEVIATGFGGLLTELEKVNFEAARLPPSALNALTAPEFAQSSTRFQAYLRNVCRVAG